MGSVYFYSALVGGTILVLQTIMTAVGGGDHTGVDADDLHHSAGDGDAFFKFLSFKTLVAFATFFGLAGLASDRGGLEPGISLILATCAGGLALYIVAYLMAALSRLQSSGTVDLRNAIGTHAQVYLSVPAERSGQGKVLVAVQGRKLECKAVTTGPELPTGVEVQVVGLSAPDTLEVAPIRKEQS